MRVAIGWGWVRATAAVAILAGLACCWGAGVAFGVGFGSEGEGAGQFTEPRGIAVAQASSSVFLVDALNLRVERWSGEGVFERLWGRGVTSAGGALCVAGEVCVSGEAGAGAGEFAGFPAGVAVDNSAGPAKGNVYVVDPGNGRVQEFTAEGVFVLTLAGTFGTLEGNDVAVDAAGVVYVGDENRVQKFSSTGVLLGEVALPGAGRVRGLAVDSAGDMYVVSSELAGVRKYDAAGVELGEARDPTAAPDRTVITVDGLGDLFVYDNAQEHLQEYASDGTQVAAILLGGRQSEGLAFSNSKGVLYVVKPTEVVVLTPPSAGPMVVEGSERIDSVLPASVVGHALVNPEGPEGPSVFFEYGPTASYGSSTTPQALEAGFEDQPVTGALVGLLPATVYHFRVVAKNGSHTTFGMDQTFETAPAVSVETESATEVTADSARLEATLNPHGVASEYRFEYGTSTNYGASVPVPDAALAAASEGTAVHVWVQGLSAATRYHYRVVAHNELGTHAGLDQTFTTESPPPPTLIDGRQWEMVSPVSKHGSPLEGISEEGALIQAAEDGHALTYVALAPVSDETPGSRSVANTQLVAARTGPGVWSTQDISTKHEQVTGVPVGERSEYLAFSTDLSLAALEPVASTPLNPGLMGERKERTPYLRKSSPEQSPLATEEFVPLVTEANTPPGTKFAGEEIGEGSGLRGVQFVSMTPDGSKVLLSSRPSLVEGLTPSEAPNLYEWQAGKLTLVSVMPNGHAATDENGGAGLGNNNEQTRGALSNDGSRVVFETDSGTRLWLRDVTRGETVQLNAPMSGVRPHPAAVRFQIATGDGSRAFFTSGARLTPDATATGSRPDLYMCDVRVVSGVLSCALQDLTVDVNRNEAAGVLGDVIGIDETGRYVYFVAAGALAPGAVQGDCEDEVVKGALCNLYVRDVVSGVTALVAVVADSDHPDWWARPAGIGLGEMTAGVSGNGQFLAFMSSRPLTGFDNRDAVSGARDLETFEFNREASSLVCVSCGSSGARPHGMFEPVKNVPPLVDRPHVWAGQTLAGSIPGWTRLNLGKASYRSRYLFDNGRLFFNSNVGLVAGDGNGREDVYEYEPGSVPSCGGALGCVGLLSGGSSSEESAFLDASATGEDVFFLTGARLDPGRDVDGALDVYDAHVCSVGVPCASGVTSVPPACSTVDSCRVAPAPQPDVFGAAPSQLFNGNGNVVAPAPKVLSRAEKLARALRTCARKPRRKRAGCRREARRLYGPVHKGRVKRTRRGHGAPARSAGVRGGGVR